MDKSMHQLYEEREKRIMDVIALKKPDRVPTALIFAGYGAQYAEITQQEGMFDLEKHLAANWKTNVDLAPDLGSPALFLGPMVAALDCKTLKWPGNGLDIDRPYQYVEGEYMKADEYDAFLFDPSDFVVRKLWPRMYGNLSAFGSMPHLCSVLSFPGAAAGFLAFGLSGAIETLEALRKTGEETARFFGALVGFTQKLKGEGLPMLCAAAAVVPFDMLGDFMWGTKGLMLDMYRQPQKVILACEKLFPVVTQETINAARMSGNPRVLITLHKGEEKFMSIEQFKRFYWPTFREMLLALVKEGLTPIVAVEGKYDSRLEIIKDVPAGKMVYCFEDTDMVKAKEILHDTVCIASNVPASLLVTGTPDQTKAYCKKLIDTVGKDGGYIMAPAFSVEDSKPENLKVMYEFTREYRVY